METIFLLLRRNILFDAAADVPFISTFNLHFVVLLPGDLLFSLFPNFAYFSNSHLFLILHYSYFVVKTWTMLHTLTFVRREYSLFDVTMACLNSDCMFVMSSFVV